MWEDLAEILALAVNPVCARKGIGTKLVSACLEDAENLDMKEVFALTYVPGFLKLWALRLWTRTAFQEHGPAV